MAYNTCWLGILNPNASEGDHIGEVCFIEGLELILDTSSLQNQIKKLGLLPEAIKKKSIYGHDFT